MTEKKWWKELQTLNAKGDDLPNIYLLHDLTDEEINQLYHHSRVNYISLTHGEGFGRPLLINAKFKWKTCYF